MLGNNHGPMVVRIEIVRRGMTNSVGGRILVTELHTARKHAAQPSAQNSIAYLATRKILLETYGMHGCLLNWQANPTHHNA